MPWRSVKARALLAALARCGWTVKREGAGSHVILERPGWPIYIFSFHEGREVGPRMLARVTKRTGLRPEDL